VNVVGVFVNPKWRLILSKRILKWRKSVVGRFGSPK
jgi:hypothetical protein